MKSSFLILSIAMFLAGCSAGPTPGPDKQGQGMVQGAIVGAGTGAITGAQLSAATGPGAAVGAGFGAVAGSIRGMLSDDLEETAMRQTEQMQMEQETAWVHQVLSDHYNRRIELHPTRDIYPADLFFAGDEVTLRPESRRLVEELTKMNLNRMAWSRLVVAVYTKSIDENSAYAKHLSERRANELVNYFVRYGIEGRRLQPRAVVVKEPVLIDPYDEPRRYAQAVELIPLDR